MKLGVYNLKKVLFQGDVESLTCATVMGEITVLSHHRPLLSMLKEGTLRIVDTTKKEHFIPVVSGFLEVSSHNEVTCVVD